MIYWPLKLAEKSVPKVLDKAATKAISSATDVAGAVGGVAKLGGALAEKGTTAINNSNNKTAQVGNGQVNQANSGNGQVNQAGLPGSQTGNQQPAQTGNQQPAQTGNQPPAQTGGNPGKTQVNQGSQTGTVNGGNTVQIPTTFFMVLAIFNH